MDPMGTITPIISIRFFFSKSLVKKHKGLLLGDASRFSEVWCGTQNQCEHVARKEKRGLLLQLKLFGGYHPRTWLGYVVHSHGEGNIVFVPLRKWVVPLPNGHGVSWLCNNGAPSALTTYCTSPEKG